MLMDLLDCLSMWVQSFVSEQVDMLRKCGLTAPDPMNLPEVIFHNPNTSSPGRHSRRRWRPLGRTLGSCRRSSLFCFQTPVCCFAPDVRR